WGNRGAMGYGIDLGSTAVKVVALRRTWSGFKITAANRLRTPHLEGPEQEMATLKLLHQACGRNGQRAAVIGLTGRDINLQILQQPAMKPLNYRVMMGYELDQRRGQATDLYLDYCTLREPDQFFPQYLALIGIGKNTYVDERIGLVSRTGLDVRDAVPNSFALFSAYKNAYDAEGGTVLLLDVGSDNMDMAFVRGGKLIFARNASSGARVFDGQVAGVLNLSMEDAERVKVARANLGPGATPEEDEDEIRGPIRSAAGQISGFITSSINHAKLQLNDRELTVDKVYLSGGGSRVRGLAGYLQGALKIPVELLDPFRRIDTSTVDRLAGEGWRELPTDMAIALGLGQLLSAGPGASTLSILPDPIKKRRNFFKSTLWLAVGGGALAACLLVLTMLSIIRKTSQTSSLERFQAATKDVKDRIDGMEALEVEQRDLASKVDSLLWPVMGGRGVLDVVARLKKILPQGVSLREVRLAEPGASKKSDRDRGGETADRARVAINVKGRGLVIGELESDDASEVRLRGQAPIARSDIAGDMVRWPSSVREVTLVGEVDENIRDGARKAIATITDGLSDSSRGVKAELKSQKPSDKPGWRVFEIVVSFE
ncbi:MAG TPA: pilus assembly protein PilM, partial [Planctomycetota bacterium]|nr:pilus assembly protein PilM [Planctomycetota bacterium]